MPDLLVQYGVAILFAWAFAVQAGLPLPAAPVLLGAGALSGSGRPLVCAGSFAGTSSVRCPVPLLAGSGLSRPGRQGAIPRPSRRVSGPGQVSAGSEPARRRTRRDGLPPT